MVEQKRTPGRRGTSVVTLAGAAALAVGGAITAFGGWPRVEPETSKASTVQRLSAAQLSKVPEFRNPDEARRYFDAKAKGDELTMALLDRALAKAEAEGADPKYVAGLERERTLRRERREAYSGAQGRR